MAAALSCAFRKSLIFSENTRILSPIIYIQERYAKRKGKRAESMKKHKELKAKKQEEMSKQGVKVPGFMKIDKSSLDKKLQNRRIDVSRWLKSPPVDDVWLEHFHKKQAFTTEQALQFHRETHHPTIYNKPDALLHATIELNLKNNRKSKFVPKFTSVICYPNEFMYGDEKKVLAICKTREDQIKALDAGAVLSGGSDIIKGFQSGDLKLSDFDHVVAHPDIVLELTPIRGLLKKHFPSKQAGNFGVDIPSLVNRFKHGIQYSMIKDSYDESFGWVDTVVGCLDMKDDHLKENITSLLKNIDDFRPTKVPEPFIIDVILWSPPSTEKFYLRFWDLLDNYEEDTFINKYTIIGPDHYVIKPPETAVTQELV